MFLNELWEPEFPIYFTTFLFVFLLLFLYLHDGFRIPLLLCLLFSLLLLLFDDRHHISPPHTDQKACVWSKDVAVKTRNHHGMWWPERAHLGTLCSAHRIAWKSEDQTWNTNRKDSTEGPTKEPRNLAVGTMRLEWHCLGVRSCTFLDTPETTMTKS